MGIRRVSRAKWPRLAIRPAPRGFALICASGILKHLSCAGPRSDVSVPIGRYAQSLWTMLGKMLLPCVLASLWLGLFPHLQDGRIVLASSTALADNVQYAYDSLGRIVEAVNTTTNQAAEYSYDSAGNITSIKTVSTGTLSIAGFSTTQGPAGIQVTIYGTGFNLGTNTVTFNGVTATIISATATQLIVIVPSGTSSGPVSVSNSGGRATAANLVVVVPMDDGFDVIPIVPTGTATTNFTILSSSNTPTISGFTPALGPAGTTLTISGNNFQLIGQDNVVVNQTSAPLSAASATSLSAAVPGNASSGLISVTTPYGTAISNSTFYVVPPGYQATSVGIMGPISVGSPTSFGLTANRISIQTFTGTAGQYLTMGISSDTIANATIKVYEPNGSLLVSQTVAPGTAGIQLPQLPDTGTYSIVIDPGTGSGSITFTLLGPITNSIAVNGSSLPLSLASSGQRALVTFNGTAGQYVTVTTNGGGSLSSAVVSILTPDGATLISGSILSAGGSAYLAPQLPITGTYTVLINPQGATGGNLSLQVAVTTPLLSLSQSNGYSTAVSSSGAPNVTFAGVAGQQLTLVVSEANSYIQNGAISVTAPNGVQLGASGNLITTPDQDCLANGCHPNGKYSGSSAFFIGPLPYTGVYFANAFPASGQSGNLTFKLLTPVTAVLTANGGATNVATSSSGQGMLLTFTGNAGQQMALAISENGGSIAAAGINVLAPNQSSLVSGSFFPVQNSPCPTGGQGCTPNGTYNGSGVLNLGALPASGTYSVLVQQPTDGNGTLSFTLSTPVLATLAIGGSTVSPSATFPGQEMLLTFTGASGQRLALTTSENGATIAGANIAVLTPAPQSQIASSTFSPVQNSPCPTGGQGCTPNGTYNGSSTLNFGPLSASGTYSVLVQQTAAGTGALSFSLGTQ